MFNSLTYPDTKRRRVERVYSNEAEPLDSSRNGE